MDRFQTMISFSRSKRRIHYIHDGADWALESVATGIERHFLNSSAYEFTTSTTLPHLPSGSILHFGNRYTFFNADPQSRRGPDEIVLTWLHGQYDSPEFHDLFVRLKDAQAGIRAIVTSCIESKEELLRAGIDPSKIVLIPLGVDLDLFKFDERDAMRSRMRQRFGFSDSDFVVGSFQKDGSGWLDGMEPKAVKGPDILVSVLEALNGRIPNLKVLLTGPSRGYVKSRLSSSGIHFVHEMARAYRDMPAYYSAIDAYLISSRVEGGPLSLPESWAMHVPVVSTRMGMPRDWIRDGENGFLHKTDDIAGMADRLAQLSENPKDQESLLLTAANDVRALDWKAIAEQYADQVYSRM